MGSGASAVACETPGGDLKLPETKLRFTSSQLRALNSHVEALHVIDQRQRMSVELENKVEALVQRIVDGAGQKDPRFRCCHLIALHRGKKMRSRSLEYLVTLDSLPVLNSGDEQCVLHEGPTGYTKLKLSGRAAERWEEFLTPSGFLCRDKVVERWVELIASCAHARGGGGSRVLCARAALHAVPYHYCYLERASAPQSSTNLRLAIVEGAAWVMVRVGAGQAEAKLVLGARTSGCSSTAYTNRIPLTHPMALLHYTAAQTGFYAVAIGPPSSMTCSERQATWQLWHPALEATLDAHCCDQSTVSKIAGGANALIDQLRDGVVQGSLRVLSRYAACCALRRRLERCGAHPHTAARCCISAHASHHLLLLLDSLIAVCERRCPAGYIYDVDRASCARRCIRTSDADWLADANCLRSYLLHLHVETAKAEEIPPSLSETLESVMFRRWENLIKESKPVSNSSTPTYCNRQLRYIWRVTSELVNNKKNIVCNNHSLFRANLIQVTSLYQEPIEDLIHILAIMLDQARDLYLINNFPQNKPFTGDLDREHITYRSKKWNKLKDYYDASSACLIDAVRRDPDLRNKDLVEDTVVIKHVLNWIYKGAKDDKKYLGPVLKPYLEALYLSSLETSWFLEDFDSKKCLREFEGLKEFCVEVHDSKIDPCMGLLELAKKLSWAKGMVDFIDRSKNVELRLVFPTGDGMAVSFPVKLPSRREHISARLLTLNRRDKAEAKLRLARRCVLSAFATVLLGEARESNITISRHNSTEEILNSVKTGHFWRNTTKPDIIPNGNSELPTAAVITNLEKTKSRRRSRRNRPMTFYGFPEISLSNETDAKTMRRKYHTLKSLVYTEPVETMKELRERSKSAGSSMRVKEPMTRPNMLETLDFINGVRNALCVEESGTSDLEDSAWAAEDDWMLGQTASLNVLARTSCGDNLHNALGDIIVAMLYRGKFTVLQELCSWLGESREAALFALHRLARAARSRSSERATNSWKFPEAEGVVIDSPQKYKTRPADYFSGDEAPPPPPLPRKRISISRPIPKQTYSDYLAPKRLQDLENNLNQLEILNSKLKTTNLTKPYTSTNSLLNDSYTGIINPMYDEKKIPKEKFSTTKRSKSLGRNFSTRRLGLEVTRYNITLGYKSGKKTNDVVTAIMGTTGETGLEHKGNFYQKYSNASSVVGDSYKVSRVTID